MYVVPEELRDALREPLGPVWTGQALLDEVRDVPRLCAVGDVVTATFIDAGLVPEIMVIDGKTKRTDALEDPVAGRVEGLVEMPVQNEAGTISTALWEAVAAAYASRSPTLIRVDGEEDLAALPCIAHAPDGAKVVYGQPGEGAVVVTVEPTTRRRVLELLAQMEVVAHGDRDRK